MPLTLEKLRIGRATIPVKYGDEEVRVTYRAGLITPAWQAGLRLKNFTQAEVDWALAALDVDGVAPPRTELEVARGDVVVRLRLSAAYGPAALARLVRRLAR